ncbi:MAG: sugar-transfer associated ATP-grasp domain-containing protein [Wenzhouxiangella sp.]
MKRNYKQHRNKAEDWYSAKPMETRVCAERVESLRDMGFWARNELIYDFDAYPENRYANDRDFFYMHPLNGWLSKLIDDKRFIPIVFRSAPHLVPELSVGIEDANVKFVLKSGVPSTFSPDIEETLEGLFDDYPWLFLKPAGLSGGRGSFRFSRSGCREAVSQIDPRHAYLISNCVSNESYSQKINPHGVNTIRVYFFRPLGKSELRLFRVFHRFGTKLSSPADNLSRGGVVAEVDLADGRLSKAVAPSHEVIRCSAHPESGEVIEGVVIPDWEMKRGQIQEMLNCLFFLEFGALDIAVTPTGLKVLEVNSQPERRMLQINAPAFIDEAFFDFCLSKGYGG